jgi:diguanylate cyclase (GGDEF)-like protein
VRLFDTSAARTRSLSLGTQLAVAFALLTTLLAFLLSLVAEHESRERIESSVGASLAELSRQMADKLDRSMWARYSEVRVLSALDEFRAERDPAEMRALLDRLQQTISDFTWMGVTNADGIVIAATGGIIEGADISALPVHQQGIRGPFIGDVHEAGMLAGKLPNPTGEAMRFVDIAVPLIGDDGGTTGVLAAHLSWEWARTIEHTLFKPNQERRGVEIFIVSKNDTVLLGTQGRLEGRTRDLARLRASSGRSDNWNVTDWPDGTGYVVGFASAEGYLDYPGLGWTVVTRQPAAIARRPADELRRTILIWGFALAVIFALGGWFLADRIAAPLRQIADGADRIARREATSLPVVQGSVEARQLSIALRRLLATLSRKEDALGAMEQLAHHDSLTGLANRVGLEAFLETALPRARREARGLACFAMDLDRFKPVHDTYGHAVGDLLLRAVAVRLRGALRGGDLMARLGGDEFVAVITVDPNTDVETAQVSARLLDCFAEPFDIDEHSISVGVSIGSAQWPRDGSEIAEVFRRADEALYRVKREQHELRHA